MCDDLMDEYKKHEQKIRLGFRASPLAFVIGYSTAIQSLDLGL